MDFKKNPDTNFKDLDALDKDQARREAEVLQQLSEWGLKTDVHNKRCTGFDAIRKFRETLGKKRDEFDYEIDGVVIKVDDHRHRESLGSRQRSPRWALAWKFPPQKEITGLGDKTAEDMFRKDLGLACFSDYLR